MLRHAIIAGALALTGPLAGGCASNAQSSGASSAPTPPAAAAAPSAASSATMTPRATAMTATTASFDSKFADSDGVKIHYVAGGQGPLVVMIHGFPDYSQSWAKLMPALSDGYRVAAMDTRGYNLSDKPTAQADYAMPKLVADVAAVIKAEGRDKAIVIGHDWGAAIAWQVAFQRPDLVDKLVILSVPHPTAFAQEIANNPQQQANSQYARNFQKEDSEKNLTAEGLAGWVQDPADKAKYVEAFKRSSFAGMMNYYRMNYPRSTSPQSASAQLPPLNVPLLVIHGMKDQALLASGHNNTWNYVTKDTTILMAPDAGHFVQHDAADLVNRTIRSWLDDRAQPLKQNSSLHNWTRGAAWPFG